MPAEPDGTSALRDSPARYEGPPTRGVADTPAIDDYFRDVPSAPPVDGLTESPSAGAALTRYPVERVSTVGSAVAAERYEVRKVHRMVRHIEPWSVLKISLIFYFCLWIIMLVAGTILWHIAASSGVIDNIQTFIEEIFALEKGSFAFEGAQIFRAYAVGGLVVVVAATGFTVLLAVLFNLISDLTGGVRVTVIEEETARPERG